MEKRSATQETKLNFTAEGDRITTKELLGALSGMDEIADNTEIAIRGEFGKTGVVVENRTHRVVSMIKHPDFIVTSFDPTTKKAEFGGVQTLNQIETSMAEVMGMEHVQRKSQELLNMIQTTGLSGDTSNFGTMGMEDERWHYDGNGNPFELPFNEQIELQANVQETPLDPDKMIFDQAMTIARSRMSEAEKRPENIVVNAGFGMLGGISDSPLNNGDYANKYVGPVAAHIYEHLFDPQDEIAKDAWNNISQKSGYEDFYDMKKSVGTLAPMAFSASHVSLGLRHEMHNGKLRISLEEAIALSDMVNSNFGTLMEWMTYSSPIAFEQTVEANIDGEMRTAKDARAVLRLGTKSAYPGKFIRTTETLKNRLSDAIINGKADRIDRAAYIAHFEDGTESAGPHARVRLRQTNGQGFKPFTAKIGRVEFVGGPATSDIVALMGRNALFQLMGIASYEALANGQSPIDYYRKVFPSMSSCDENIDLAHAYNFYGEDHPKVQALVEEGKAFVRRIRENYTHEDVQYLADLAEVGLNKIVNKTKARNFDEFLQNPDGCIADVIANMQNDGVDAKTIARELMEFEQKQARKVMEVGGDVMRLVR